MNNIQKSRAIKDIIDALGALTIECVQLKNSACNVYCVSFTNEQMNLDSYLASFGRNAVNKISGLKTILNQVQKYANTLIPEGTPLDLESNVKPWEGGRNAED
jgi:hypothetical protein